MMPDDRNTPLGLAVWLAEAAVGDIALDHRAALVTQHDLDALKIRAALLYLQRIGVILPTNPTDDVVPIGADDADRAALAPFWDEAVTRAAGYARMLRGDRG